MDDADFFGDWRGTLQATVSADGGHIDPRLGSMTFAQMYREVPWGCRYAIALARGEYWLLDLYRAGLCLSTLLPIMGPYEIFPNLDAAICAAMLNYYKD